MKELFASVKDNLAFLGICVLIFAALFLVALLFEKLLLKNGRRVSPARYISYVAMFSALAGVLMLLEIPLFFAPSFYKLDLSEIPVLICTFFLGPVAGVVTEFLKVFLKLLFKGTSTAFFGSLFNAVYLLPRFAELYGIPMDVIIGMGTAVNRHITSVSTLVLFAVVPFNLLKGIVVSLITFLLYKRLGKLLKKGL